MKLTRSQFNVLVYLNETNKDVTQREISKDIKLALGSVNKVLNELNELGLVKGNKIINKGIFIAAGFGSRLAPITLTTPKPLVTVNGKRMIETLLEAVVAVGIEEIIIVRGYLKEQFDCLLEKYPNIKFVDNLEYNEANNISSVMKIREHIENCYILEADLVLYNPKLIKKYQYTSNYLGVPVDVTEDWCFKSKRGIITKLMVGGTDCHHMFGVSYWNTEDGKKLSEHVKTVYEMPGGKERYWDQVALEYFK